MKTPTKPISIHSRVRSHYDFGGLKFAKEIKQATQRLHREQGRTDGRHALSRASEGGRAGPEKMTERSLILCCSHTQ